MVLAFFRVMNLKSVFVKWLKNCFPFSVPRRSLWREKRIKIAKDLWRIYLNLYGDCLLSNEFNIFNYFVEGWMDENTFRLCLKEYAEKKKLVTFKDLP